MITQKVADLIGEKQERKLADLLPKAFKEREAKRCFSGIKRAGVAYAKRHAATKPKKASPEDEAFDWVTGNTAKGCIHVRNKAKGNYLCGLKEGRAGPGAIKLPTHKHTFKQALGLGRFICTTCFQSLPPGTAEKTVKLLPRAVKPTEVDLCDD